MTTRPVRTAAALAATAVLALLAACIPPPPPGPSPTTTTTSTTTTSTTTTSTTTTSTTTTSTTTTVPAPAQHVMSVGHADVLEVTVSGESLILQIKDDSNIPAPGVVFRDPAETVLHAKPGPGPAGSQLAVPANAAFGFLGAPGDPVWILPEVQNPNLLWPGLSTERISGGVLQGNQVQVHLDAVIGPGSFHLYNVSPFGAPVIRYTTDQPFPQTISTSNNTHAHYSWAFSAEGTYTMTFRATATLANGTPVTSGPVDYTFVVGPLD